MSFKKYKTINKFDNLKKILLKKSFIFIKADNNIK